MSYKQRCPTCGGSGLLPFVKNGKVIPYAWVYCECREPEPEYSVARKPDDFDFPMSYSVYRGLCQEHGWDDPGPDRPTEPKLELKPISQPRPVDDEYEIDQLKARFLHIQQKFIELSQKRKPKGKY